MSDRDTITLPREVVQLALDALHYAARPPARDDLYAKEIAIIRTALAAEPPKQEALAERLAAGRLAMVEQLTDEVDTLRRENERLREALEMIAGHRPCVIDGFKRGFMPGAEIAKAALRREET